MELSDVLALLDRFDAMLLSAPFVFVYMLFVM